METVLAFNACYLSSMSTNRCTCLRNHGPMISPLATASDQQLKLAREMAVYISPRPGFTQHPLTVHAAAHMDDLLKRAIHFTDAKKT
jgi:hypothetical protein